MSCLVGGIQAKHCLVCGFCFVELLLFFQREGQVVERHWVVRLVCQGLAVMANGCFVVVLGRQGKAQGVLDQSPGLGGFAIGICPFGGQFEAVDGLVVQPFTQLYRSQFIELGGLGGSRVGTLALQAGQGDLIAAHPPDLASDNRGCARQQHD